MDSKTKNSGRGLKKHKEEMEHALRFHEGDHSALIALSS